MWPYLYWKIQKSEICIDLMLKDKKTQKHRAQTMRIENLG